jgi:hypothetical protein
MHQIHVIKLTGLLATLCAFSSAAYSATFYVDSSTTGVGDAGPGPSTSAPWKTLARVTQQVLQPGDIVLLRCGRVWREELLLNESGTSSTLNHSCQLCG